MKSLLTISLFSFIAGSVFLSTSSEQPLTCKAAGRSISSVESPAESEELTEKAQQVCIQEEKINSLKDDLDRLEKEREKILAALEKLDSNTEKEQEEEKEEALASQPQIIIINNSWPSMATQLNTAPTISYGYSPFHNSSSESLSQYFQMAMAHRLNFAMSENDYWHPEWDTNGHLTNPQYGFGSGTWNFIENMYREPTSFNQFQSNYVY
ncbi:MAG: hypothetical protein VXV96_12985 [Bdellovibrionota bacterium]|nr:hypothetical protein [Bdellovibrionota bacterium]